MKVKIGEHQYRLPTFRVGYLGYFSVEDLNRIRATETLATIRKWIPAKYAENLAKDLIAPDMPVDSVYLGSNLPADALDEDSKVIDEELFYAVAYVCSLHFCLLHNPALNLRSVHKFIKRRSAPEISALTQSALPENIS